MALIATTCLAGCPAPLSRSARAQDAVGTLNLHARFGRIEVAMNHVDPSERDAYAERHKQWGASVRVSDYEVSGLKLTSEEDAEVNVRVAWFRPDEGELYSTTVKQTWHDTRGSWLLRREERVSGNEGLFGEPVASKAPREERPHNQFPTIRIGAQDDIGDSH